MDNIRNFCILSHVDHGKSTLADRLLELTKTVPKAKMREQYLDSMDLERERGITIKMQPVRMVYRPSKIPNPKSELLNNLEIRNSKLEIADSEYILNLIDTPGHVDFSYEVSRSLAAVEGAVLLVDATKGIQAQTLAHFNLAKAQGLEIIPAVNKIDLAAAQTEEVKREVARLTGKEPKEVLEISAKLGTGVEEVLKRVVRDIPCPKGKEEALFQALIFDSQYDAYKGVVAFLRVMAGKIKKGDEIVMLQTKTKGQVKDLGHFAPQMVSQSELGAGEIGYIATSIKEIEKVRVGETLTVPAFKGKALAGYLEPKPMVFASIYPESADDYNLLKDGLAKLRLADASLSFEPEFKEALGRGFRCGFLGSLHLEIIVERLKREFGLGLVISSPAVIYKIIDKKNKEKVIFSAGDWPLESEIEEALEPWVTLELMAPKAYLGRIMELAKGLRGKYIKTDYFGENTVFVVYEVPLASIIVDFYDNLKGATQGYGSLNYEFLDYRESDLVKLDILIAGVKEEAFSKIVVREEAEKEGRRVIGKLKEVLPPQLFQVPLHACLNFSSKNFGRQAALSGKIIARETIRARRKDVTVPLYGGDYTRKRKLLEQQKKGKKKLKEKGGVRVPSEVFLEVFKR